MKRILLWLTALAIPVMLGMLPLHGTDAGDLEPAQLLLAEADGGGLRIVTDTGAVGTGADPEQALSELTQTAQGSLFLQTAQSVVLTRNALSFLPQTAQSPKLRPAAKVYVLDGELPDAAEAAGFLKNHEGGVTLGQVRAAMLGAGRVTLPVLRNEDGRLMLLAQ